MKADVQIVSRAAPSPLPPVSSSAEGLDYAYVQIIAVIKGRGNEAEVLRIADARRHIR